MNFADFRSTVSRAALLAGVAALALAAEARAQDADGALDEVVVTATKTVTNLQDTPIAIAVADAEALVNRHVQSLADLGDGAIPTLRVAPFFARSSALTLGMRGIGASSDANQPARDQAVGVYVNGVYLGRAQGLGAALYDVERIEVLKGPQGTLFGRNTEGGAISIVTKAPSGEFGFKGAAGVGNYEAYRAEAHLDLPEVKGVSVKLDGLVTRRDGTVKNPFPGQDLDFNAYDRRGFQAQALWRVSDSFSADYAYDDSYDDTTPYYVQLLAPGALPLAPAAQPMPDRAETARIGAPLQWSEGRTWGHRLTLDWRPTEWMGVKSITAYRELTQTQFDNGAAALSVYAPNGAFSRNSIARVWQDQFSQELQVTGALSQLQFAAGAFYFRENVRDNAQTPNTLQWNANGTAYTVLPVNLATHPFDRASHAKTVSYGVFGQATWTPAAFDRLHLTLGARATHDERTGALEVVNGALPVVVVNGVRSVGQLPLDAEWDHVDPLVSLAYDVSDDVNLYAKWSTGYKAGGANSRSLTYRAFDPEVIKMYELGAKTEFWDRRARLNLAAFYGEMEDVQVDFNVIIVGNNRGTLETTNAASGKTKGLEADLTLVPIDGLTLSASYAYTKVELSKAFNPFTSTRSVVYPLYTPEHAGSVAVDWERPLLNATLKAHLDVNYADKQITNTTDPTPSDDSTIVNGRLALGDIPLRGGDGRAEVAIWARNLFDEAHVFLRNTNASLGTYAIYNEPRTFGLEARLSF